MMTRCFCDKCGKDITNRDIRFRISFDYFGDKEISQKAAMNYYDLCEECVFKIQNAIEGQITF